MNTYNLVWQKIFTYYGGKKHLPFKVKQWMLTHKYEYIPYWYYGKDTLYSRLVVFGIVPKITGKKLNHYSWIKRRFKK
jgi:hypothetical protein